MMNDAFDNAMTDDPIKFAGKLSLDAWTCVLKKGVGKVPFDPQEHKGERTSTVIEMTVEPLDPTRKLIQRDTLDWTAEWKKVVRPSIKALVPKIRDLKGLGKEQFNPLREMDGLYVIGQYVERPENEADETWTTLAFIDVFETKSECQAEFKFDNSGASDEETETADPERASMAQFLPALWQQAGEETDKFLDLIEQNPMLAEKFDRNSPEVLEITGDIPL